MHAQSRMPLTRSSSHGISALEPRTRLRTPVTKGVALCRGPFCGKWGPDYAQVELQFEAVPCSRRFLWLTQLEFILIVCDSVQAAAKYFSHTMSPNALKNNTMALKPYTLAPQNQKQLTPINPNNPLNPKPESNPKP